MLGKGEGPEGAELREVRDDEPRFLGERGVEDDEGVLVGVPEQDDRRAPVAAQQDKNSPTSSPVMCEAS